MKQENNALLEASKNEKGFITLKITLEGGSPVVVDVSTFNGTRKKQARAITYALYKQLGGK